LVTDASRLAEWEILRYLALHPDAKDTAAGIASWWVPGGFGITPQDVRTALDELVSRGWVDVWQSESADPIYSLRAARSPDVAAYLNRPH